MKGSCIKLYERVGSKVACSQGYESVKGFVNNIILVGITTKLYAQSSRKTSVAVSFYYYLLVGCNINLTSQT